MDLKKIGTILSSRKPLITHTILWCLVLSSLSILDTSVPSRHSPFAPPRVPKSWIRSCSSPPTWGFPLGLSPQPPQRWCVLPPLSVFGIAQNPKNTYNSYRATMPINITFWGAPPCIIHVVKNHCIGPMVLVDSMAYFTRNNHIDIDLTSRCYDKHWAICLEHSWFEQYLTMSDKHRATLTLRLKGISL